MDPITFSLGALSARRRLDEAITPPQAARPAAPPAASSGPVQLHGRVTPGMGVRGDLSAPIGRGNLNLNVGLNGPFAPGGAGFGGAGVRYTVPVGAGALGLGGNIGPNGAPQNVGLLYSSPAIRGGLNYNLPNGAFQASARIPFARGGLAVRRKER